MLRQFIHLIHDLFKLLLRAAGRALMMTGLVMFFGGMIIVICISVVASLVTVPFDPDMAERYVTIVALVGIPIAMLGKITYSGATVTDSHA